MTTTTTPNALTTNAATTTVPATSAPTATVYLPDVTADRSNLFRYAAVSVHGRLTIVHGTPDGAPVLSLHRRTTTGRVWRIQLDEGISAWLSGDRGVCNRVATCVALDLSSTRGTAWFRTLDVVGPVVFTATDGVRPAGLTTGQIDALIAAHARAHLCASR